MNPENSLGWSRDTLDDVSPLPPDVRVDVPYHGDVLPDGRETVVIGDVETFSDYCHPQGDNPFGFRQTCGLCSCEGILRQFGIEVTEADIVAHAITRGLCTLEDNPRMSGRTTLLDHVQILSDFGIPAHYETSGSLEDLASRLEQGRGVILALDCGVLWDNADFYDGRANHAVTAIGVARHPETREIQGFYVNDSGTGQPGRFVDAATMNEAWREMGGTHVVTDPVHRNEQRSTP
jgi:Peptidase_C39 like family